MNETHTLDGQNEIIVLLGEDGNPHEFIVVTSDEGKEVVNIG